MITTEKIKQKRLNNNLSQRQCAELVNVTLNAWQKWEAGDRKMSKTAWELFCIKLERIRNIQSLCALQK